MFIIISGAKKARPKKINDTGTLQRSVRQNVLDIPSLSLFPQNCAINTAAPEAKPNITMFEKNAI